MKNTNFIKITIQCTSILDERVMSDTGWMYKQSLDILDIIFQHKLLSRNIIHRPNNCLLQPLNFSF